MKILNFAIIIMMTAALVYAGEETGREGGIFSRGSFLSDVISSATDKLSAVGSGEEKIVSENAKGVPDDIMSYDGDPFRRAGSGFTREEYRRNREMSEERRREGIDRRRVE